MIENLAGTITDARLIVRECFVADFDRTVVLFLGQAQDGLPGLQHLVRKQFAVGKVKDWIQVLHIVLGEHVVLFCECRLDRFGRCGNRGARVCAHDFHQRRSQHIVHREEDHMEGLFAVLFLDQVVNVGNSDFCRETGIDSAAARTGAVKIGTGVVGINNILGLYAQAFEISIEQRRVGVDVENPGNADANFLAIFHQRNAFFSRLIPEFRDWNRIGNARGVNRAEHFAGRKVHEVRIFPLDLVEPGLDVFHIVHIFDQTLFAGGDDQPLFAMHQRNLGDLLYGDKAQVVRRSGSYIDKRTQTIVLAEMAAGLLVAGRAVFDFPHGFQSDKRCPQPVAPQAQRLNRSPDGS